MIEWHVQKRLMEAFPGSYINQSSFAGEFIPSPRDEAYITLSDCENELDVKCKLLEFLSPEASTNNPYKTVEANRKYHDRMRKGMNKFMGTHFTTMDMNLIFLCLGNGKNHTLTVCFVRSGYDLDMLRRNCP